MLKSKDKYIKKEGKNSTGKGEQNMNELSL